MYHKSDSTIWQGRIDDASDSTALRWHQVVKSYDLFKEGLPSLALNEKGIALLGFSCDAGVRRNQGRVGAKEGPSEIRKSLSPLAYHFDKNVQIVDAGNVFCEGDKLEDAQQELAEAVYEILNHGYFPVLLGGGHEIAWGHFQGIDLFINKTEPKAKIGIINFDAHFDLRKPVVGATSGTPFFQMATQRSDIQKDFNYLCLGIQQCSNTRVLFDTAKDLNVSYISSNEMITSNIEDITQSVYDFLNKIDKLYVTIDLDGFSAAIAPGVSAPAHDGYSTDIIHEILDILFKSGKVISCDIAELNPVYDIDNRTARLAASMVYGLVERHVNLDRIKP